MRPLKTIAPRLTVADIRAADVARADWESLLCGRPEHHAFFAACEAAPPDGVELGARVVRDNGAIVALVPTFKTRYRVPLGGLALPIDIHGIGSPLIDACPIGLSASLSGDERIAALSALLRPAAPRPSGMRLDMIVMKDVTDADDAWLAPLVRRLGFARVPTLPRAEFAVRFSSEEAYLDSLARKDRKYLRHAIKRSAALSCERLSHPGELEAELYELYRTHQMDAKTDSGIFDAISPTLFSSIAEANPNGTLILVYRHEGMIAGFAFCQHDEQSIAAKYVALRQPLAKEHKLYFRNWMEIVRFALERGLKRIHVGQNSYPTKQMLGCRLERNWIYYRHPGALANIIVRQSERFMRFDTMDEDLETTGASKADHIAPHR